MELYCHRGWMLTIKGTDLSKKMFEELTGGYWGDMYLSPDLTAYIKAKGLFGI